MIDNHVACFKTIYAVVKDRGKWSKCNIERKRWRASPSKIPPLILIFVDVRGSLFIVQVEGCLPFLHA